MDVAKCPFCTLEMIADRIIWEDKRHLVLLSNPRMERGHTLVVPKRHVELPWELTRKELGGMLEAAGEVGRRLKEWYDGVDTWQKTRPEVYANTIKVDHVHYHVIPSNVGEERYDRALRWSSEMFAPLPEVERREMLRLLQPAA